MIKKPISLLIDDGAPGISVYYTHAKSMTTADGRPLEKSVPNDFLKDFCDVTERLGIRGKLSVVPMPGGLGTVANGIEGYSKELIRQWLDTVRCRVAPNFSLSPEMLTHAGYWDLEKEAIGDLNESDWSQLQTRKTLTPYITRALEILKAADLEITGVSSPWRFGAQVQREYELALSDAMEAVLGKTDVWYALHGGDKLPGYRVRTVSGENGKRLVHFRCTVGDLLWKTIDSPDTSAEYISSIADQLITEDGREGAVVRSAQQDEHIILLTHWQSMFSNGTRTGLRALELAAERIEKHLSHQVQWTRAEDLMRQVLDET